MFRDDAMTWKRPFRYAVITLVAFPAALYVVMLALQIYSAWEASRTLDRLEALRIGDPAADFDKAVRSCREQYDTHVLISGSWSALRYFPSKVWDVSLGDGFRTSLNRAGLRYWELRASDKVSDGRIRSLSVEVLDFGYPMSVGAGWRIATDLPEFCVEHVTKSDAPTCVNWFAIDAIPGGEGYHVNLTDRSSAQDLSARVVNRRCLYPFGHCSSVFQLLPNLHPLLQKQQNLAGR